MTPRRFCSKKIHLAATSLLACCLYISDVAADETKSSQGSPASDTTLLDKMQQAEAKALDSAPKLPTDVEVAASPLKPWSLPDVQDPKPTPTPHKTSDEMLKELVDEVEKLRAKEIVTKASLLSTQRPRSSQRVGSTTIYSFKEGDVYEVYTAIDRVTDIQLQAGETLTNPPVAGDTVRWKIGIIRSGKAPSEVTHIILKPLDIDLETNLLLTTNKHVYHLRAISGSWYIPSISWNYPLEEDEALAQAAKREASTEELQVQPEGLRFDYDIDGDDYEWKPLRVFDDGQKTYLQMPKRLRVTEAPALFVMENGDPMLVNYRVKGDFYIVDRLFERAQLRVGPKRRVDIYDSHSKPNLIERIFQ